MYFILAYFFLFALALFWSIHASFFYFFLGCSAFCFFLGFINRPPVISGKEPRYQQSHHQLEVDEIVNSDLPEELKNILSKPRSTNPPPSSFAKPEFSKILQKRFLLIFAGMMVLFFVTVFSVIFSSGDNFNAEVFYERGEEFYQEGQYDSAYAYYKKALAVKGNFPEALTGCGNALMKKNDNDGAIRLYDEALAIDPDFELAKYQKGLVLYYQNQFGQSMVEMKDLLDLNPSYFQAMQVIGDDFYNQKQYDSALYWYDGAYANGIRNRYLCHLMGYIYQTKGNTDKAITLYKEALEYDSEVADIYVRLGELLPGEEGNAYRARAVELQPAESK